MDIKEIIRTFELCAVHHAGIRYDAVRIPTKAATYSNLIAATIPI